jgi:hypothetical protein
MHPRGIKNTCKSRVDARVNQVLIYSPTMTTMCVTVHFSLGASNSNPIQASSSSSSSKLQVLELTRKKIIVVSFATVLAFLSHRIPVQLLPTKVVEQEATIPLLVTFSSPASFLSVRSCHKDLYYRRHATIVYCAGSTILLTICSAELFTLT